jgi:hypothetical protein
MPGVDCDKKAAIAESAGFRVKIVELRKHYSAGLC